MKLIQGDCLEAMKALPDNSVDAIITDLPYGTTACKWDVVIPFEPMWTHVKRLLKKNGVFVTTASQPFTSALVMSNPKWFKYCLSWDKVIGSGFQVAKYRPLSQVEDVCVFGVGQIKYNPQKTRRSKPIRGYATPTEHLPKANFDKVVRVYNDKHPTTLISFKRVKVTVHPTQKPVALMEYLIRTYTNEGDTVLDFCMGSGTTGVSCVQTGRHFIGIDKDIRIATRRIEDTDPLFQAVEVMTVENMEKGRGKR